MLPSYINIYGDGYNSILEVIDNSTATAVFDFSIDDSNNITISDLSIHGNKNNNLTSSVQAIAIHPTSSPMIYSKFNNLYIKEMSGTGISIYNSGADNIEISGCLIRDCVKGNLYSTHLKYASITDCKFRTAKTGYAGIFLEGVDNNHISILGCHFDENALYGLYATQAYDLVISNCGFYNNLGTAIYINRVNRLVFTGNVVINNLGFGMLLEGTSTAYINEHIISNNQFGYNNIHGKPSYGTFNVEQFNLCRQELLGIS